jgi:WD40 repeat protein
MGRMLGAQYIVSGSLLDLGDVSRIRFKTIAVESAGIAASTSVDITNDTKVKRLLAIGGSTQQASAQQASAQGRSRAQGGNTASGGAVGANSGGSSGTASAGTVSSAAASTPAAPTIQSAPTVSSMPVPVVTPSAVSVAEMPLTIGPSNPENYRVLKTIQVGKPVWAVTYSPDGSRIAGTDGKLIKTYTAQTGNVWKTFDYSSSYNTVSSIDFSPDGKYLVTGGEKLRIWNVESGAYRDFDTYSGVRDVSYSPDGKHIAYSHLSSGTSTLYVCNANNGQKIWEKRERSLPTWGPDGKKLASDGEYILDILDSATGEMIKNSSGTGGRSGYLTWHSDGRQIAMGDRYLINISIFDIETSKVVWKLTGHKDRVKAIAFSPDCRRLISGSSDKTIKVWDVESGWEIKTMTNHTNYVNSVAYSPDGKHFVSGSEDGTIIIWGE